MDVQLINNELLADLHDKAVESERLRQSFDLRTTPDDTSQRMLNVLEPGTHVPIHRHLKTTETVICLKGSMDWVFYEDTAEGSVHEGEKATDESHFKETARYRLCPKEGQYGIQVPLGAWHNVEVYEPTTILEAKDGKWIGGSGDGSLIRSASWIKEPSPDPKILVTGSAGFIGSNLVRRLLSEMHEGTIVGLDNLNDYYDPTLKEYRLAEIAKVAEKSDVKYEFVKGDLADKALIDKLFDEYQFDVVVNMAAQAGVRYSIENPDAYIQSNMMGFYNILEACRHHPVQHLVYASSSSVYGGNKKVPFSTDDRVDNPVSLYAATKKSDELFAHCYSKLYNIPTTGLRLFTVYGPAGRPDMAYFGFTNKLLRGETIQIFNYGNCRRDFTYIDDIVEGIYRVMQKAPEKKNGEDGLPIPPYAVYNIGGGQPENLLDFVQILQEELLRAGVLPEDYDFEAHKQLVPMQPGDVPTTYADTTALERDFGFTPKITLREGLRKFAEWYKQYYG